MKERRETEILEEMAGLRDALRAEEQTRVELSEEMEKLRRLSEEKDAALQVRCFCRFVLRAMPGL